MAGFKVFNTTLALRLSGLASVALLGVLAGCTPAPAPLLPEPPPAKATQISAGGIYSCALIEDATVRCWGSGAGGRTGLGAQVNYAGPRTVGYVSGATEVATGDAHGCALVTGGTVKCWGWNGYGQIGIGSYGGFFLNAIDVPSLTNVTAIDAGGDRACALIADGTVKCWGSTPEAPQLNPNALPQVLVPTLVPGLSGATAISVGGDHACAIVSGGAVKCWGLNDKGELGNGTTTGAAVSAVDVVGVSGATAIGTGYYHTCAVLAGGEVRCWGGNSYGQLGDGTTVDSGTPATVAGVTATSVDGSLWFSCAALTSGSVSCWGNNYHGGLGDGTFTSSLVPVSAVGVTGATAVSAGTYQACALISGGSAMCWGAGPSGELGYGYSIRQSNVPGNVKDLG